MVTKTKLSNGIRVISENIPHAHSVSIGFWVANGSRHEDGATSGVAHFIEHLLFKGTARRSALDIAREIDSVGGILNAFTGREFVCYYAKVLSKFLPQALDLLSDIFLHSVFDPEEIEKERKVILQEISMIEDAPDDYIHDLLAQRMWQGHPLGMPVIGTEESVGALSRETIVAYRNKAYRPEDIIIAAAGRISHDELLSLVAGQFDTVVPVTGGPVASAPEYGKSVLAMEKDLEQVHLCLGTRALAQNHPQRYEAFILNTVLGGSMSSRLFQEVREKQGLAYSIYSYISSHSDTGSLAVYAGASPERLADVIDITLQEMRRLKHEPLPLVELDAAKEQIKGNLLLSLEGSDNRMTKLAKNEIYFGCYQSLREIMEGLDRVTPESIIELSAQLFDDRYFTLVLLGKVQPEAFTPAQLLV
jgi:predicted Zn-dependent peptidase